MRKEGRTWHGRLPGETGKDDLRDLELTSLHSLPPYCHDLTCDKMINLNGAAEFSSARLVLKEQLVLVAHIAFLGLHGTN